MSRTVKSETKGKVIERLSLYSDECVTLLRQAVGLLPDDDESWWSKQNADFKETFVGGRYADSSDEEEPKSSSSDSEENDNGNENGEPIQGNTTKDVRPGSGGGPLHQPPSKTIDPRQHEANIRKQVELLTCHVLPVDEPQRELHIASSLLTKQERQASSARAMAQNFLDLATRLADGEKRIMVLFLRSGRFAGAVFGRGKCLQHRTAQRYTVRKGQGKAQSVQDGKKKPKSIGSQLRRAGEEQLKEDVRETLGNWKEEIRNTALVLISCPKSMIKSLYDSIEPIIERTDERIRWVPLDLGRPTFENAVLIHDVMTAVTLRQLQSPTEPPPLVTEPVDPVAATPKPEDEKKSEVPEPDPTIPLSDLHEAARTGNLTAVRTILENGSCEEIDQPAGKDFMTPLHYSAESTTQGVEAAIAADIVLELLVDGHADPMRVDARNRPPYFLASHDKVRDAFRMARAKLGEAYCDWDAAKVGPPLTEDDLRQRKEKETEKKKKKKARQKEVKAKDRAQQQQLEQQKKEQEAEEQKAQEAKRMRDCLEPKKNHAPNVCDFCQKESKGRQRSQMFHWQEYAYCTSDCLQKHKRELMAAAAMARMKK